MSYEQTVTEVVSNCKDQLHTFRIKTNSLPSFAAPTPLTFITPGHPTQTLDLHLSDTLYMHCKPAP